jgi:hypothetical protein
MPRRHEQRHEARQDDRTHALAAYVSGAWAHGPPGRPARPGSRLGMALSASRYVRDTGAGRGVRVERG